MPYQWTEALATGVAWIDEQHRCLFDILNELEARLDGGEVPERLSGVLDELADYATQHFGLEEGCMLLCECPWSDKNKAAHQSFLEMLAEKMAGAKSGTLSRESYEDLRKKIEVWLEVHIRSIDQKMAEKNRNTMAPNPGRLRSRPGR